MANVRVTMSVSGFTDVEASEGLPDLLDEFRQRPWILRPTAAWDANRKLILVAVEYESDDAEGCRLAAHDEVRDCVIACFKFQDQIAFKIEDSCYAPSAQ
jgi:hypothetical protein